MLLTDGGKRGSFQQSPGDRQAGELTDTPSTQGLSCADCNSAVIEMWLGSSCVSPVQRCDTGHASWDVDLCSVSSATVLAEEAAYIWHVFGIDTSLENSYNHPGVLREATGNSEASKNANSSL